MSPGISDAERDILFARQDAHEPDPVTALRTCREALLIKDRKTIGLYRDLLACQRQSKAKDAALGEVEEYFDQLADAEYLPGKAAPVGNEEMRLLVVIRDALAKAQAHES